MHMSNGGTPRDNELSLAPSGPGGHLVPGDGAYHNDKRLIADLTSLNGQVSRYVLRHLDVDAGRAVSSTSEDELVLGQRLVRLGEALQTRARRGQDSR